MNLEKHISSLLYRYQCVTVPGFGAFLTEIQSAQLIENTNSFLPPKKVISFNSHLQNNDGLLANHIAQTEQKTYDYAITAIECEVINWKKTIEENGLFLVKNIGSFKLNTENKLVFTPLDQTNYLSSSFGLNNFISPSIRRTALELKFEKVEEEYIEPYIFEFEKRKTSPYLKYAAVFAIGIGVAGSIGYPMYQNYIASETLIVEKSVQKQVQNKIQEATFFISNPIQAVTLNVKDSVKEVVEGNVKEEKMPYHIMADAFRKEENAQKALEKLIALGYKARRFPINKFGLYPVVYGSYATQAEAEKAKVEIQKKENPKAWILVESL